MEINTEELQARLDYLRENKRLKEIKAKKISNLNNKKHRRILCDKDTNMSH